MTPCIGWPAEPSCPKNGIMHGCVQEDGHLGDHKCACGSKAKGARRRGRTPYAERRDQRAVAERGTHWRGKGWIG